MLELAGRVREVVRVGLRNEPAVIRLLHEVFIALLLSKFDSIVLGLELQVGTLHAICRRLPTNKRVLPPVTPLQNIPIHSPVVAVPISGLCSRLRGAVDSAKRVISLLKKRRKFLGLGVDIPDGPGLKIRGSTGKNSSRNGLTGFTAVHHALGHRGELPEEILSATDSRALRATRIGALTRCRGQW